ncbi:hypothetical protein PHMEG_00027270 [Phytophthora megakarya]|uniref:Eukaryotic/viral aspartic protease n=1 Tax=Phytophthora megakarya TaxID=4795 RepID=A0A225V8R3_9STRA|nr:hypothetical protein PHMEG_00027270 [Phytophthora megakarya]
MNAWELVTTYMPQNQDQVPVSGISDLSGQNAILDMDFMVPAGVRMDLADGSMRLPDEAGIPLNGRKRLYGKKMRSRKRWVPTVTEGHGRIRYLVISNIGEEILRQDYRLDVGMIPDQDKVPRSPGLVSVGSRRYREWQNMALESTVDTRSEPSETTSCPKDPVVQRPTYRTSRSILAGPKPLTSTEVARGYRP